MQMYCGKAWKCLPSVRCRYLPAICRERFTDDPSGFTATLGRRAHSYHLGRIFAAGDVGASAVGMSISWLARLPMILSDHDRNDA
jgi:hypothetical protein